MEYNLTRHAQEMLERRRISQKWVESILQNPNMTEQDKMDPVLEHRLGRISEYGNRVLRVVVNPNVNPIKIITVYWDRSMRDKL